MGMVPEESSAEWVWDPDIKGYSCVCGIWVTQKFLDRVGRCEPEEVVRVLFKTSHSDRHTSSGPGEHVNG